MFSVAHRPSSFLYLLTYKVTASASALRYQAHNAHEPHEPEKRGQGVVVLVLVLVDQRPEPHVKDARPAGGESGSTEIRVLLRMLSRFLGRSEVFGWFLLVYTRAFGTQKLVVGCHPYNRNSAVAHGLSI